jgi:hypothetical protein
MALTMAVMAPEKDALSRARELYNLHQYDTAIRPPRKPAGSGRCRHGHLILGRAYLNASAAVMTPMDLIQARAAQCASTRRSYRRRTAWS